MSAAMKSSIALREEGREGGREGGTGEGFKRCRQGGREGGREGGKAHVPSQETCFPKEPSLCKGTQGGG